MLWDMARFHNYDLRSPYNREAALWAASQSHFAFPMDHRPRAPACRQASRDAVGPRPAGSAMGGERADPAARLRHRARAAPARASPSPSRSPTSCSSTDRPADRSPESASPMDEPPGRAPWPIVRSLEAIDSHIDDDDRYGRLRLIPWWRQDRLGRREGAGRRRRGARQRGAEEPGADRRRHVVVIDLDESRRRTSRGRSSSAARTAAGPRRRSRRAGPRSSTRTSDRSHSWRRAHRPRPRPVRRDGRGHRLPRQPRGPALGQPPVLEGRHPLGRRRHPGDPGGRPRLRAARLGLLRVRDDQSRLSTA